MAKSLFSGLLKPKAPQKTVMDEIKTSMVKDELKTQNRNIFTALHSLAKHKTENVNGKQMYIINRRHKDDTLEVAEHLKKLDSNKAGAVSKAWYTALFFTIVDFVIALLPVIQLEFYKTGNSPTNFYIICEFLNVVALMDPLLSHQSDPKNIERRSVKFKLIITILLIVLANVMQVLPIPLSSTEVKANKSFYYLWCGVSLAKIVSIHDLLKFSKEYRLILETITQIVPLLGDLFIQLILLVLFYGVIGVKCFGGLINAKSGEYYESMLGDQMENNYEMLTFNDTPNALLFLYSIMINNDWSRLMNQAIMTYTTPVAVFFSRLFFLSFYFLGFMLVLNTTIGAIIDFINTYLTILQEEQDNEEDQKKGGGSVLQMGTQLFGVLSEKDGAKGRKSTHKNKKKKGKVQDLDETMIGDQSRSFKTYTTPIFPDD